MPAFNTSAMFAAKKAPSNPVVKVPRNVKEALCIDKVMANGIFKLEPQSGTAMYDRCYIFEDINYINQGKDKKMSTLLELMKLFKSLNTQFKISLINEQRDMQEFMDRIFSPLHGKEYPEIEEGIGAWISQKLEEGTKDMQRLLLLTVTCRAKSFEEAASYFATLDTSLQYVFTSLHSRLYRMSGAERLLVIQRMLRPGEKSLPPKDITPETDHWKNQILPAYIHQDNDYCKINDKFCCVMFAHDYEQSLNEEKVIHSLTDSLFPTYITLDFEPVKKRLLKDKLLVSHANNERIISKERDRNNKNRQYGAGTSYQLSKKKGELEELIDQVDDNDEEALFLGFLVYVWAETLEELEQRVDTLKQNAIDNGYTLDPYYHRQLKALNTVLPIGGRQVDHMRSLLTSSAVAFQPFYANDLHEEGGTMLGLNETTKRIMVGNRKKLPNPHGMITGHTGLGKSFFIKETEIAQPLIMSDDDIIIIDPNNEQRSFIRSLSGGQYFDLTPQCAIYMNPFEVPEAIKKGTGVDRNMFIARKTEFATAFCAAVMTNLIVTQVHMNYIGRAVREMYEEYFDARIVTKKKIPTLSLMRQKLIQTAEGSTDRDERRMIFDITDSLEEYTEGVYDMFAHPSNLEFDSRLIGFGLKNIPESVWEPAMLTIMHFLSDRIEYNQESYKALHLVVDEAQVLCSKPTSAEHLLHAIETYRKVGAIVTLAVQNLTRVLENDKLRDMFSNCAYKCFLDQGGVDAVNLAQIQELSEREYMALENGKRGHGVIVWNGQVYLFDAVMAKENPLYEKFNTDFHEKAEEAGKTQKLTSEDSPFDSEE